MKKVLFGLSILLVTVCLSREGYSQAQSDASVYLNRVYTIIDQSRNETWQYLRTVIRGRGARAVENKRKNLVQELKDSKLEMQGLPSFQGDYSLKNAAVEYLKMSIIIIEEDFSRILDMEEIAEQSYDLMEAYLLAKELANEKLDEAQEEFSLTYRTFAADHNITLIKAEEDKMTERIKNANSILKYYNELYLIFFKAYKQEAYVMDALEREDISSFEQNTSTLARFSREGLDSTKQCSLYEGDGSLKVGVQRMLNFYLKEADEYFPPMTDYYIKKDNFEKIKRSFDAKKKNSRTQKDVDEYNAAVEEFNKAAGKVNMVMETSNKERSSNYDHWNQTVEDFFERHSK